MENSVENLYLTIAQSIVNSIDDDWSISIIRAELTEGSIEFQSEYIPTLSPEQPKYFDVPFEIFEAFEELHAVTSGTDNNWNRATFSLEPSGSFNIDFEWDQALADEIESLNNE
ncbi:hypothetical protein D8T51_13770 [Vibrio vulnificus]|jgi:hypothetical protein|uniref:DUF600 family protein n=4 Tax=Vibrio vulnificus TaxID=672 RepID=A0AAN1PT02_VIBVL|nr:immunity protein YezG family protein [Vibrio vulnificus]ALM73341.1 hypothetical protein FORC9_3824 [Vibrio vulnificus]AMG10706.1 hypothetical protein AL549_05050 [Vibrio vulnificus]ANH65702.1 hypothetical protein FORC16_3819 [Vibrio vulnificus]ANN28928.1 hypothetical protein FORC17_3865 [Vibrio vulnificus]AXX62188.1 hypothetical protein FORC53_3849 [Vibrio vulnificus]